MNVVAYPASAVSSASNSSRHRVYVSATPGVTTSWLLSSAATDGAGPKVEHCEAGALNWQLDNNESSRACLLIESPVSAVARALADGSAAQCQSLLDTWCAAGRQLLKRAVSQPARCLCANVDEIARATSAWHQVLARFLGVQMLGVAPALDLSNPRSNPLGDFIAQAVVRQHEEAATLFEQLLACCVVLDAPEHPVPTPLAAAEALCDLRTAAATTTTPTTATATPQELVALRAEADEALDRLFTAQADLEAALIERESQRRELDATRAESRQALGRQATAESALKAALTERDRLCREFGAANDSSRAQQNLLQETQQALAQARADAHAAADAARQEANMLLEKLHDAHEELARHYLDARALRSMPAMLAHGNGPIVGATGVHIVGEHVEGQHRHLDLQLRDVQLGGRRRADARVRLVDHLDRPGLVLFSTPPAGRWLSAWDTSGQEGGQEYMLIVPGDTTGCAALSRFGRTDWQVVAGLAGLVLRGTLEGESARWSGVARRLCRELAAMPTRLRYDELEVGLDGQAIQARFGNVMFGALEWPSLTVQWTPVGASGRLEILSGTADNFLPLAHWPTDTGVAADRWRLPVGAGVSARDKRHAWAALPEADRSLLLALLDALPAAEGRGPGAESARLATASRHLLRESRGLLKNLDRRRLLRRLLGRFTSR